MCSRSPHTLARPTRRCSFGTSPQPPETAVVTVEIRCDLMDEGDSGYVWTFCARREIRA